MKVALLGDAHANLHALDAVLAHAQTQEVAAIWNVGDFVGYFAFPDEVVQRLRAVGAVSILGNYDLKVLRFKKKAKKWRKKKHPLKYFAFRWAFKNLPTPTRAYLRTLPEERRLQAGGMSVLMTHGSPASNEEPLTAHTPAKRLRELAALAQAEVVVCGHSHQPLAREAGGVWFINGGSVGRPDDGDPRASYAILQFEAGGVQATHYRVTYDVAGAVAAVRSRNLPEPFAQMLVQGKPLDEVL